MKLSRSTLSLLTVLVVFLALGAGVGYRILAEPGNEDGEEGLPATEGVAVPSADAFDATRAQPVQGREVARDTLWISVVASGEARANRRAKVTARTEGVVEEILVRENDLVEAGEVLVRLDTLEAAMRLAQARADLTSARVEFQERLLHMGTGGLLDPLLDPEEEAERERILRATTGLDREEVNVSRAEMELEWTRIRAPFTGRVADVELVEGSFLSAGTEVMTVVELNPIRVEAHVLEAEVAFLEPGRRATVRFSAFPGEAAEGRIETVNPVVDPETRMARVTVSIPNPGGRVKPGMYARVSLEGQGYPDRIVIPREAVLERGTPRREMVFVARNLDEAGRGQAEWRYVTTGLRSDTHVEIVPHEATSMLEPGEVVLVDGHHYLAHDVPIELVEDVEAAGGRPGR